MVGLKEKIIENWLTSASERGFQVPFALSLLKKGFKVIHISRHCAMEFGKDVIAIDTNGIVNAYQLKSKKRVNLSDWREINTQISDLCNFKITHPSIPPTNKWHISHLVINGELEEEATEAINQYNEGQKSAFKSQDRTLKVTVYGQLYQEFLNMDLDVWPTELKDDMLLLELFLSKGKDIPPIDKVVAILERLYTFNNDNLSKNEIIRRACSATLLISIIANNYVKESNHYSEYLCWGVQLNFLNYIVEKHLLKIGEIKSTYDIVINSIKNSLENLYTEVHSNEHLIQDLPTTDVFIIKTRRLIILGLCAYRNIIKNIANDDWLDYQINEAIKNKSIDFCGEASFVYLIPILKYYSINKNETKIISLCEVIVDNIIFNEENKLQFANPYYSIEFCLLNKFESLNHQFKESFLHKSYFLESMIRMLIFLNQRQYLESVWYNVTKISFCQFFYDCSENNFLYRSKTGKTLIKQIPYPTSWKKLNEDYSQYSKNAIPRINDIVSLLNLIITFPHRSDHDKIHYILTE